MYDFKNKIALVTGASRGIGYATALELARAGCHVIALARTVGGLEKLDDEIKAIGGTATLIPFDLKKDKDLLSLGPLIADKFGRLDIVIGNAAILGPLTPTAHLKVKDFDSVLYMNLTVNHRLIITLDPLLQASPAGRAVFVTSGITALDAPYWGAYSTSKTALEKLVETYALENKDKDLKINLFDPGIAATAMRAEAMPGEDPSTLATPQEVAKALIEYLRQDKFETKEKLYA